MDSVVVFEVHFSNINRYVTPFIKFLKGKNVAQHYYVVYPAFVEAEKIDKSDADGITFVEVSKLYRLKKRSPTTKSLFFNYSYRLADLYWTYRFKRIGYISFQQQHGMYADFLKRSFFGYFSAIRRKLYYFKYLSFFGLRLKGTIFLYLVNKDFVKSKKINAFLESRKQNLAPVLSNHLLIWGSFWKEWFIENQFYTVDDTFTVIGNPDYHKFIVNNQNSYKEEEVCYIAQTFVEDGRMESEEYMKIIAGLADGLKERLVIKLHPRSQKELFQKVLDNGGALTYDFPVSGTYLGHYSSMLALALNMKAKVFLLEVNNETIPHYFKDTADKVFESIDRLVTSILKNENSNSSTKEISFFFENKEEHPYELIFQAIAKQFQ
ncbi:polysialyltransferase family glycosyltransferase [Croceivirga thetidis]|uniref:Uncharacterized protein n=1 Tax=Croceivirga thetidis TaxID=2721623 RepID=A0ABX1GQ43_9FLAO|nr:polysialyltransferase family glycosyltransferase [Croceivirga thetidis]NKI31195.1 hypothetical protein [Croceivirga thetidis]